METIIYPSKETWLSLCERNIPDDDMIEIAVTKITEAVRKRGDKVLLEYTRDLDGYMGKDLVVSDDEINRQAAQVPSTVAKAIETAADNISAFHKAQIQQPVVVETTPGVQCIQRTVPIQRVGLYIPGGQAPLFSTVLMLAIPAKIAGCKEIILCTPHNQCHGIAPEIFFAARLCGINRVYRIGGAQAIAAMAYGTETIKPVNKIFGPGNRFVTKAKQIVSRFTAIDMPAGPSEVMVLADDSANPLFVAADMLSQAEHGPDSQAIAVCTNETIARNIITEVSRLQKKLNRQDSIEGSLSHSRILVLQNIDDIVEFANMYAPEHLIISMTAPWKIADQITTAGSVFIGNYSPESAGDYASGTNHTLPTSGWGKSYSGVNLDTFSRKITFQELSKDGLLSLSTTITTMAHAEGLDAHALAVKVRTENYQ